MSTRTFSSSTSASVRQGVAALKIMLALTLLLGVIFPGAVWATGQLIARDQAAGSLVTVDGRVVGSSLLGQQWSGNSWFHSRPSASEYAGGESGGTNLNASPELDALVVERRAASGLGAKAPADALTASSSGLDPHISPQYAMEQAPRVAAARGLTTDQVTGLISQQTQGRVLGFLGTERVNVLNLNLGLQALASTP